MPHISRFFQGERRDVGVGAVTLAAILAAHALLETARDALFLTHLPAGRLPWVYLTVAGLSLILLVAQSRYPDWFRRRKALSAILWVGGCGTLIFYFMPRNTAGLMGLYVWSALLATISVSQFWLLIADRFYVTQAKRAFTRIATGGLVGALIGSSASALVVRVLGPSTLLLASAVGFIAAGWGPSLLSERARENGRGGSGGVERASWRVAFETPYPRGLFALAFVSAATITLCDLLFKTTVAARVPRESLGTFLAVTYAVLNASSFCVQIFVAGRLLQRFGMLGSLLFLPFAALSCLIGFGVSGAFAPILILKCFDGSFRHSLNRTAVELLFVPLDAVTRAATKALSDGPGARGGQGVASLIALALVAMAVPPQVLTFIVAGFAALWLAMVLGLRRHYVGLFRDQIKNDAVATAGKVRDLDLVSVETLVSRLNSPDDQQVIATVDLLASRGKANLIPAFILYHPSSSVVLHSLKALTASGRTDFWPAAMRLVGSREPAVKALAIDAYSKSAPFLDVELLRDATGDADARVRASAFVALVKSNGVPKEELTAVVRHLAGESDERRAAVVRAIGAQNLVGFDEELLALVAAGGPLVGSEICKLMRARPTERLLPTVTQCLADRASRSDARAALIPTGEKGFTYLIAALADLKGPSEVRRHIPRTLSRFAESKGRLARVLLAQLSVETDPVVQYKILRGLGRMVTLDPELPLDRAMLDEALAVRLRRTGKILAWRETLRAEMAGGRATRALRLAHDLLVGIERNAIERAFRILGLRYPLEDFREVFLVAFGADERTRAGARELLENLLNEPFRPAVLALVDRSPLPAPYFCAPTAFEVALGEMIDAPWESVRLLAAEHALETAATAHADRIRDARDRAHGGERDNWDELLRAYDTPALKEAANA